MLQRRARGLLAQALWETAVARAVAANALVRTLGKVSFVEKLYPNVHGQCRDQNIIFHILHIAYITCV
jgi:hypothetical protein